MTKATSDNTKLNFITDQGSTRATVRWACRAERFDAFRWLLRDGVGTSAEAACPEPTGAAGALAAAWFRVLLPDVPERRKDRAGEDGASAGGSGMSQANAAGETVGVSVPEGAALEEDELEEDGLAGDGLATVVLEPEVLDRGVLDAGVLRAGLGAGSGAGDGSDGPLVSAGRAGMPSMEVASALVSRMLASSALAGVSVSVVPVVNSVSFAPLVSLTPLTAAAPAGVSPVAAAPRAVRFDPLPLVGDAGTTSAWADFPGVRRGAVVMTPAGLVSWVMLSSWSSSPSAREVTMVGEAPPDPADPLGPFVRLSKPSSI